MEGSAAAGLARAAAAMTAAGLARVAVATVVAREAVGTQRRSDERRRRGLR